MISGRLLLLGTIVLIAFVYLWWLFDPSGKTPVNSDGSSLQSASKLQENSDAPPAEIPTQQALGTSTSDENLGYAELGVTVSPHCPPGSEVSENYISIVKIAPHYPPEAAALRLTGYVLMEYTVTRSGDTRDIQVMDATSPIFEQGGVQTVKRYRYKPRRERGACVETTGVRALIIYGERQTADLPMVGNDTEVIVAGLQGEE